MKRLTVLLATVIYCMSASAQEDSVRRSQKSDTMRIGNILIIKKGGKKNRANDGFDSTGTNIVMGRGPERRHSRITTNWWIIDLGFANYSDQTNYANPGSYLVSNPAAPAISAPDFKLKAGKSINVNIWFFMQRLNLIKRNVSLKYGLGLELNNYRYKSGITYRESGQLPYSPAGQVTNAPFIFRNDTISFSKNKLAADYLTVPLMLSFATTPSGNKKGLTLSAGVSAGYLYSQRNKQKSDVTGMDKNKGEYDLNKFKISYIGEVGLGPVRLYGSYSPKSIYERSLDIRPYTFGIRFTNL